MSQHAVVRHSDMRVLNDTPARQRGLSLVELMVSLVVAMLMIAGFTSLYSATAGQNAQQVRLSRLDNDLRTVMTSIMTDLRRAGFDQWTPTAIGTDNLAIPAQPYIDCVNCRTTTFDIPQGQDACATTPPTTSPVLTTRYRLNASDNALLEISYRLNNQQIQVWQRRGSTTETWSPLTERRSVLFTHFVVEEHEANTRCFTETVNGNKTSYHQRLYQVLLVAELPTISGPKICRSLRETVLVRSPVINATDCPSPPTNP